MSTTKDQLNRQISRGMLCISALSPDMYVSFPCIDLGYAGKTGIIPEMCIFFGFGVHGIWKIDRSTGCYGTRTENHGKTDIATEIVRAGMGNQDFRGNDLNENEISIFSRELVGWNHGNDKCT